jgi:ABC-type nitrate/sulfonate/bicarbonate transport system ATPase subunit
VTSGGAGAVEVRGLSVVWPGSTGPNVVLDGLDLSVPAGSFVSIVGPSWPAC